MGEMPRTWDRKKKEISASSMDKYDRIRDAILNDTELTDVHERRLRQMAVHVYPLLISEVSISAVSAKMVELGLITSRGKAYNIITEVERIYGRVREVSKESRRAVLVEILAEALGEAKKKKDFRAVARIADRIAKLEGLYMEEGNMVNVYQELVLPAPLLTSDPEVVEFEEVDTEEYDGEE